MKNQFEVTPDDMKSINRNIRVSSEGVYTDWRGVRRIVPIEKFPIRPSPAIASLIGHSFGDGHTGNDAFTFTNTSDELLANVVTSVGSLPVSNLSFSKRFHKAHILSFPRIVRDILVLFGAPVGNKVRQCTQVPAWIKDGSREVKSAFLRALFDNEATVQVKPREIILFMHKRVEMASNLHEFFQEIKCMLEEFGINGATITQCHLRSGKNGVTIQKRLRICGTFNFIKFAEGIGFEDSAKRNRLKDMSENAGNIRLRVGEAKEKIIEILKQKGSLNTSELKKSLPISHWATWNHLRQLEKENIIIRVNNQPKPHSWQININKAGL